MMHALSRIIAALAFAAILAAPPAPAQGPDGFTRLGEGLWMARLDTSLEPVLGDGDVVVLRIDPALRELRLVTASEHGGEPRTLDGWAREFDLAAAINASMYLPDGLTSTGYMKNFGHVNNATINRQFGAFLLFNPHDPELPTARIVDSRSEDAEELLPLYGSVVQNFRMVGGGEAVWEGDSGPHAVSCVGEDEQGRILFIHTSSAVLVRDMARALVELPLGLVTVMYVEGGQQAGLFIETPPGAAQPLAAMASQPAIWPVPSVLGVESATQKGREAEPPAPE